MPIEYRIDAARRLVTTSCSGEVGDEDLLGWARKLSRDPEVPTGGMSLVDFRGADGEGVTADGLDALGAIFAASGPALKTAVVADSDLAFGMSRMYELKRQERPLPFHVFRDADEAMEWLDQPEPTAED